MVFENQTPINQSFQKVILKKLFNLFFNYKKLFILSTKTCFQYHYQSCQTNQQVWQKQGGWCAGGWQPPVSMGTKAIAIIIIISIIGHQSQSGWHLIGAGHYQGTAVSKRTRHGVLRRIKRLHRGDMLAVLINAAGTSENPIPMWWGVELSCTKKTAGISAKRKWMGVSIVSLATKRLAWSDNTLAHRCLNPFFD